MMSSAPAAGEGSAPAAGAAGGRAARRRRPGRPGVAAARHDREVGHPHQPVLAGEAQRAVSRLLLREPAEPVVGGVVDRHPPAHRDRQPPRRREEGIAHVVLRAGRGGAAELRRPPGAAAPRAGHEEARALRLGLRATGAKVRPAPTSPASSEQSASTRAFSALLNMSPTMTMPPRDHWPMPPSSGMSNCAWLPPPATSAKSSVSAAAGLTPWRPATSSSAAPPFGTQLRHRQSPATAHGRRTIRHRPRGSSRRSRFPPAAIPR